MKRRSNLATSATKIFLASILLLSISYSQSFDLLSAKSSDKIAQSRFFRIDSNKVLNAYEIYSFRVPVARIQDSIFETSEKLFFDGHPERRIGVEAWGRMPFTRSRFGALRHGAKGAHFARQKTADSE